MQRLNANNDNANSQMLKIRYATFLQEIVEGNVYHVPHLSFCRHANMLKLTLIT